LGVIAAALTFSVAACGGNESGRVFFVSPKDGATIPREATLVDVSVQYTIAAVPPGELTESQVRAGTGHYHVGVDTDCLPPGQVIPKADPWVHFGKGTNTAEVSLTPGKHTLTVQAGDDMHRTVEGLCQTINVTVE
jgi:hypothetical protein